ncbi:MAG: hypothetical protein A2234_03050 [Elusimicrobia bacterium RIFOXYA2_FULL_58_8]|nr:MAG: hypothetical protein A2285_09365 [Elusimicrobia bacterium RIFOXYA12_FULL_57_11]OGS12978.1 MAG: hypothetical protein A2234_03050 [Elusimicrobia bacterium RIFOXYA2_FULL_58_8]
MARGPALMRPPAPVQLEIAGIRAAFVFSEPRFGALVARRYKNFFSPGKPLYVFSVSAAAGRRIPFRPVILEEGGVLRLKRGDFDCVLNLKTGLGRLKAAQRVQTFDSFLRTFYSWLLPRRSGLLVHGAAFAKGGSVRLFPGRSGAGKSTLSRLAARKHFLLSDELVPVRRESGKFYAYGSPFWGEMRCEGKNTRFSLRGVYKLSKAAANSLRSISGGVMLRLLLRCSMNFAKDAGTAALMLALAAELAAEKTAGELRFSKDNRAFLDLL